jgi:hypothetical protein
MVKILADNRYNDKLVIGFPWPLERNTGIVLQNKVLSCSFFISHPII